MMVLMAAIGGFGLSGVGYQLIALTATGHLAPVLDASIFAGICAVFSIRGLGMVFRKLKLVSTTALEPQEFLGNVATVSSPEARQGYAASAKFTDRHGYVHLLMVEPSTSGEVFVEGDRVVLCERALGIPLQGAQGVRTGCPATNPHTHRSHPTEIPWKHCSPRPA
jgi:hypothetical protein